MNEQHQTRIIRIAQVIHKYMKIAEWMMWGVTVLATVVVMMQMIGGFQHLGKGISLGIGFLELTLQKVPLDQPKLYLFYGIRVLGTGIVFGTVAYILRLIQNVLKPMKDGRPFEREVAVNLKKMAVAILFAGGIWQAMYVIMEKILISILPMEQMFGDIVVSWKYDSTVDYSFILLAAILLFLSYIFNYGQMLQQESDETL